jgi:uroporphyrinogen-III synthase
VRETPRDSPDAGPFLEHLCANRFAFVIFLTGVGATALLREAERLGRLADTLAALRRTIVVCRGPKPSSVLHRHAVPIGRTAADPYTSTELLSALEHDDLRSVGVGIVHYGEPNTALASALVDRGARLEEVQLYQWDLPEDLGPLTRLVHDLVGGRVDALVLTSQVQGRHLFEIAERVGLAGALSDALNSTVVVASIGPVCTQALQGYGVTPRVMPATPKMGPLVTALADYFDLTRNPASAE